MLKNLQFKIICCIILGVVRVLHFTYRYRVFGAENRLAAEAHNPKHVMIMAIWHCNCFAGILSHIKGNFAPLLSQSKDGDLVAFVCKYFGIKTVRGSSSRGGPEARQTIIANFEKGYSSAITVDGPKGPPLEVKFGIIDVAKHGQVAILPFCAVADRYWVLKSWDRFRIPKPFAKIAVCYAKEILIAPDLAKPEYPGFAQQIKTSLMQLEANAVASLNS